MLTVVFRPSLLTPQSTPPLLLFPHPLSANSEMYIRLIINRLSGDNPFLVLQLLINQLIFIRICNALTLCST